MAIRINNALKGDGFYWFQKYKCEIVYILMYIKQKYDFNQGGTLQTLCTRT